jgi:hypothetical protein
VSRRVVGRSLVVLLASAIGTRAAEADRLLLESHVGNRSPDAARIAPLVRSVFERHGFTVDPLVLASYLREHAYRPGLVAPRFGESLKRASLRAEDDFTDEKYKKMIDELGNLIIAMHQNSAVFTREPKLREFAVRVMVFYALACGRQARVLADKPTEAARFERLRDDTMAEVIRTFPSKLITSRDFGDEGEELFLRIREQVNQAGRGRISIITIDPDEVVCVNEIVRGTAKVSAGDFVPGVYRVLILAPTGEARQYEVEVTANQTSRLVVDWGLDSLIVLDGWAGFKYPTEKEHAREATLVHVLSQKHTNASMTATWTVTRTRGHLAVTGTSYDTFTGKILHSGSVELTGSPASDTMLNRLADCLVGESCAEGVLPVGHPEFTPPPADPNPIINAELDEPASSKKAPTVVLKASESQPSASASAPRSSPRWLTAGGSAAMLALGGYLVYKGNTICGWGHPGCEVPWAYDVVGYAALDIGIVLGTASVYWFYEKDLNHIDRLPARWFIIGGTAAVALGAGLYAIDEDPTPPGYRGPIPKYYRNSAPPGVALGALGLASVGMGLWIWRHDARSPSMPSVSLSSSGVMLGWAGVL